MTSEFSTEEQWATWFEVQDAATKVWMEGNLSHATKIVSEFIDREPPKPIKRQAIGFRGSLRDESGDAKAANADFLAALALTEVPDFERYTLQESIAAIHERTGDSTEAERWSIEALTTAAADPRTSGAGSILRLLQVRKGESLSKEERRLVKKVIHQAWSLLRVEGQPDLADLGATTTKLLEAHRGPFSAERPPTPRAYEDPETDE